MRANRANAWVIGGLAALVTASTFAALQADDLLACAVADFCQRSMRTRFALAAAAVVAVAGLSAIGLGLLARRRERRRAGTPQA